MDTVPKSFRIILRCLSRNCVFLIKETFCGVEESWSSCFIKNLSSETGLAIHISKLISIAAFQVTMFPPIPALFLSI